MFEPMYASRVERPGKGEQRAMHMSKKRKRNSKNPAAAQMVAAAEMQSAWVGLQHAEERYVEAFFDRAWAERRYALALADLADQA